MRLLSAPHAMVRRVRRVPVEARIALLAVVVAAGCVVGVVARHPDQVAVSAPPAAATYAPYTAPPATPAQAGVPVAVGGLPDAPVRLKARVAGQLSAAAAPVRIRVPRLGVDSAVVPISGASGVLEPPSDARALGWWREGAVPGSAEGTTVMTGHTLHLGGGALDKLKSMRAGDKIFVSTARGTVRYEVRASWALSKPALAQRAAALFDQGRHGRLVLVTCYDWTGSEYLSNAVVSAAPIASVPS